MSTTGTSSGSGLPPTPHISIPTGDMGWGGLVTAHCVFCSVGVALLALGEQLSLLPKSSEAAG